MIEAGNHFVWEFCPGRGSLNVPSNAAILHRKPSCLLFLSTRIIPNFFPQNRLQSLRVRRRWLHQDTVCRGPNGPQVQLSTRRTSRNDLRVSQGALPAQWTSACPHTAAHPPQEDSENRKVGQQTERKQQHLRAAWRQDKENCFSIKELSPRRFFFATRQTTLSFPFLPTPSTKKRNLKFQFEQKMVLDGSSPTKWWESFYFIFLSNSWRISKHKNTRGW